MTIGRGIGQTIRLAPRQISREHAELHWVPGSRAETEHWRVRDFGSAGGTFLNGVQLAPNAETRLEHGDLLEVRPWVFRVESPAVKSTSEPTLRISRDADGGEQGLEELRVGGPGALAQAHLLRLLEAAERIGSAASDAEVARAAVGALVAATGYSNVALIRPGAEEGTVDLVASVGDAIGPRGQAQVSWSLLKRSRSAPYIWRGGQVGGGTFAASIASLEIKQAIAVPIETGGTFYGWLYLDNRAGGADEAHEAEAVSFAAAVARMSGLAISSLSRQRMQQRFDLEQREMFGGTMRALIAAIDAKDPYTRGHSDRVSEFAWMVAKAAGLGEAMIERVRVCGLVHDIGKIGVPEVILCKPSRLTEEEFGRIREHPAIGHKILRDIPQMRELLPGVLEHHERWDGKGYPGGLAGEAISLLGRVVCIADCFDAMTSARFYRPARPVPEVLEEVERCLGTHFDPTLGRAFLSIPVAELEPRIAPNMPPPSGLYQHAAAST